MEPTQKLLIETIAAIKKINKARGEILTDVDMAKKIGVSENQFKGYVNGKIIVPQELLYKLANAYRLQLFKAKDIEPMRATFPKGQRSD